MRAWWSLWGLLLRASTLTSFRSCEGSSSHSLQYIYTGLSEPVQGLPRFTEKGYVDGQLFVHYDSNTRKTIPQVSWIKGVDKEDPQYWEKITQRAQDTELVFRDNIHVAMESYSHNGGFHILQEICGCEWREDGSTGGSWQFGYDGKDFISFDKEILTWTASSAQAQRTKRKWNTWRACNQDLKSYLEETCIKWLKKYLHYGWKNLMRKEPPEVKVTSRTGYDHTETLICRVDGFYPKDIHVVWTRDGEVWEQEALHAVVAPNSDGTYHTWISTKVDPKDKSRFRCHVDHCSWNEPVDFVVEEPNKKALTVKRSHIGCIIGGIILVAVIVGIFLFWRRQQNRAAPTSNGASSNSGQHANMHTNNSSVTFSGRENDDFPYMIPNPVQCLPLKIKPQNCNTL